MNLTTQSIDHLAIGIDPPFGRDLALEFREGRELLLVAILDSVAVRQDDALDLSLGERPLDVAGDCARVVRQIPPGDAITGDLSSRIETILTTNEPLAPRIKARR